MILVIECDVPWIPTRCKPKDDAKIYHIDSDPLKQQMPVFYINALARYRAGAGIALAQLNQYISSTKSLNEAVTSAAFSDRWEKLQQSYQKRIDGINKQAVVGPDGTFEAAYLTSRVREACPKDTIWCTEIVTNTPPVHDHIQASLPGSWINCGGGGLGWSGGAALGIKLATDAEGDKKFVCQLVGDGSYLFSVPGSVYWIAQRYNIPILTIVLNNKGWNAPRKSLLLVHPEGEASKVSNEELNISFSPTPDYAGIARAASGGKIWAGCTSKAEELDRLLKEAVETVMSGTSAVLEAQLGGPQGKYSSPVAVRSSQAVNGTD